MFVIKHNNGTYFKQMTGIGPCFGATEDEAMKFDDRESASKTQFSSWKFSETKIVEVK